MQQPIGIIELYQHSEVLTHYCDLLLLGREKLNVFCTKTIFDDLPDRLKRGNINWFLNEESIDKFIKKNEASIKECRFLLITTVFSHFSTFAEVASWNKSAIIIHSAHTWFEPFKHINFRKGHKISDFFRLLKSIVYRHAALRKKILEKVDFIGLPNQSILKYVSSNFEAPYNADFVSIPFGAYIGREKPISQKEYISFTVTGSLGDDVRDYSSLLKAIKILLPRLRHKVQITLLGKPKREEDILLKKSFDSLKHPLLKIITFSDYISQNDYDRYLLETDYLILPLKKYTQFYIFRELTCYSKLSGSVNDMIRLGIPAIASHHFTVDQAVDESILYYKKPEDLANIILELASKGLNRGDEKPKEVVFAEHRKEKLFHQFMELLDR